MKNATTTNRIIEREIYKAFIRRGSQNTELADLLGDIPLGFSFNPRFEFSAASMVKSLILMKLKGIKSQSKLALYLRTYEKDSIRLGFFNDRDNKLRTPDQRTLSYFIKKHLDFEKKQLIEFVSKKIEEVSEKFNIVLDLEILHKNTVKESKNEKTFYNRRSEKLSELCRLVRKKIYPKINLGIKANSIFKKNNFLDILVHIALTEDFAENGSRTFSHILNKRTPTSDTLLYHIKKFEDVEVLQKMFIGIFDLVHKMSKRSNLFGGRKVDVAIDFTDWFYYGKDRSFMVLGKKPERGTSKCFRFATINVVEHGERFTLLALPVSPFDTKEKIIEKLVSFARERVPIRKLYVDRGFFSSGVINLLKRMEITFLMPAIMNDRVIDYANSVSPPSIIKGYPMKDCKFNLVVVEKDERRYAFATNMNLNSNDILLSEKLFTPYSKRWGIETSYRVKKNFRGKTTSRNYIIRQFYFMMSVVLYDLWILINLLLSMFLFGKISKKVAVTAKLFGTVLYTIVDPGGT
ncbi:MAG: transposase [Candidatus Aenigmarchaeota archaeon]|nr:transposase [Candidatus Aenigmarchaeota archaeon]